jgi:lipopolysaccharide export system permease protein
VPVLTGLALAWIYFGRGARIGRKQKTAPLTGYIPGARA